MFDFGTSFESLKLLTDTALFLSLAYLGIRLIFAQSGSVRGTSSANTGKLEQSLKRLIKDADNAGRQLNDQLSKRQRNLQRLLAELEAAEERISTALDRAQSEAEDPLPSRNGWQGERETYHSDSLRSRETHRPQPADEEYFPHTRNGAAWLQESEYGEPPSFERGGQPAYVSLKDEISVEHTGSKNSARAEPASGYGTMNIYGEPVRGTSEPLPQADVQVHVENTHEKMAVAAAPQAEREGSQQRLERIYDAAEQLLRAGKDVQYVVSRTALPVSEVEAIQEAVFAETFLDEQDLPTVEDDQDPRLGVLGGIRRQVQTL